MTDLKVLDIWRLLNQKIKVCSCYSATFQTYSRIDYFLISVVLFSKVKNRFYDDIVISDHAPCCLVFREETLSADPPRWRFQHKWLQDEEFVNYIGKQIDDFFQINTKKNFSMYKVGCL